MDEVVIKLETPDLAPVVAAPVVVPVAETVNLDLAQEVGRMGAVVVQLQEQISEIRQTAESAKFIAEAARELTPEVPETPEVSEIVEVEANPSSEPVEGAPVMPSVKRRGWLDWIL